MFADVADQARPAGSSTKPQLGRDDIIDAIEAAFTRPLGPALREGTRAMLDAAPDPYRAMVALTKSRERDAFSTGFTFRGPVDDDQRYHLDVHRCFYHDVLAANSAAELTRVMCAFDKAWIEAIDPARHGFRFDRVTTIDASERNVSNPGLFHIVTASSTSSDTCRSTGAAWRSPASSGAYSVRTPCSPAS